MERMEKNGKRHICTSLNLRQRGGFYFEKFVDNLRNDRF